MGDKRQPPSQVTVPQSCKLALLWKHSFSAGIQIRRLSISANGERIGVMTSDNVVYFFDNSGRDLGNLRFNNSIECIAVSPNSQCIVVGYNGWINVFNTMLTQLWNHSVGTDGVYSLSTSANGDLIAMGGYGDDLCGKFHLVAQGGRRLVSKNMGGNAVLGSLSMSLDGQYIACGTTAGKVHLINNKGKELWNRFICTAPQLPPAIGYYCTFVATSAHGEWTVAGEDGGKLYLFDMKGRQLWDQNAGRNVRGVGISADGTVIAVTNAAGWLQIYNKEGKQLNYTQPGGQRCALSPEAAYVVVDNGAQEVQCWSTGLVYGSGTGS